MGEVALFEQKYLLFTYTGETVYVPLLQYIFCLCAYVNKYTVYNPHSQYSDSTLHPVHSLDIRMKQGKEMQLFAIHMC